MRGVILALLFLVGQQQPVRPDVVMEDQFEAQRDVKQHLGHVVVLIYGDRKSSDANKVLGEQIHVAFHPSAKGQPPSVARRAPVTPIPGKPEGAATPDVVTVPVALIGKVPGLVRKVIRGQVKKGSPDVPVWLDFEDVMKTRFPFTAGVPNVVVLDPQGYQRYTAAGSPTPDGMKRLIDTIEALRREAVGAK
jgi:hypothetical protein